MTRENKEKLIRIREAAEMLGVHPETLRRWDKENKLKAVVINARGDRRFRLSDITKLMEGNHK